MQTVEIACAAGGPDFTVRRFTIREAISTCFDVGVFMLSPVDDLDLDALLGTAAALQLTYSGARGSFVRSWAGIVSRAELAGAAESTGLSTYFLEIVPPIWLLTQRKNYRVFQHQSTLDIAATLLADWGIPYVAQIIEDHPRHEVRIQYDESDFTFLTRLLEEAGISYYFDHNAGSTLVLSDAPHLNAPAENGVLPYIENATLAAGNTFATSVRVATRMTPGRRTIRDADFRRRLDFPLIASAAGPAGVEAVLEQYEFAPGGFVMETVAGGGDTPVADDKGAARADERYGQLRAMRALQAQRTDRKIVTFRTTELAVAPGSAVALVDHPRQDLGAANPLLVTEFRMLDATWEGPWVATIHAVPTDSPVRPRPTARRPHLSSIQSAIVVGPPGSLVHVDEFGRVRVQFLWDRDHSFDDDACCWVRVSQAWAGAGLGHVVLPRVGHEVLVGFVDGNPDQPIVVGRLFNNIARAPMKLPDFATQSVWRSQTLPGGEAYNEILFEDAAGQELVNIQAQRNLTKLVKVDEIEVTGSQRIIQVGQSRMATIGTTDSVVVGQQHSVNVANSQTGSQMTDQNISQTTGYATSSLSGGDSGLDAAGNVGVAAGANIAMAAGANVSVGAGANASVTAGAEVDVTAGANMVLSAGGNLGIEAAGDIAINAGGSITIKAGGPITIHGADVTVQGGTIKLN